MDNLEQDQIKHVLQCQAFEGPSGLCGLLPCEAQELRPFVCVKYMGIRMEYEGIHHGQTR